jgi:3-dehydro-L-gulonate 2-dehydrogenase
MYNFYCRFDFNSWIPNSGFSPQEMSNVFHTILLDHGFEEDKALLCAEIFTNNSIDGVYTHGVNRFPRFVSNVDTGHVKATETPSLKNKFGGIEQWDGNLGAGP